MTSRAQTNTTWAYVLIAVVISIVVWLIATSFDSGYVSIKYRDDPVNITTSTFEPLNRSEATVKGAWYDAAGQYIVIKLSNTYYHYCGMPQATWSGLKATNSIDSYYQTALRGEFDCRLYPVPSYGN